MSDAEALAELRAVGCDDDTAKRLLDISSGDIDKAMEIYFMEQSRANGTLAPSGAPEEGDDVDAASRLLANAKTPSESPFLAAEAAKKRKAAETFSGQGFRLGGEGSEGAADVAAATAATSAAAAEDTTGPVPVPLHVTFYANGFTVEGDFYDDQSPEGKKMLQTLHAGNVPAELHPLIQRMAPPNRAIVVDILLADHREDTYVPPPPTLKPFSGTGRTLGATAPPAAAAGDAPAMPAPGSVAGVWRSLVSSELWLSLSTMVGVLVSLLWNLVTFRRGSEASAAEAYELVLDPDQPATVLKLQLADDSRHEVTFNFDHTVRDVIRYAERLGANRAALQTGFPPRKLLAFAEQESENQPQTWPTLKQAGLLSSRIVEVRRRETPKAAK